MSLLTSIQNLFKKEKDSEAHFSSLFSNPSSLKDSLSTAYTDPSKDNFETFIRAYVQVPEVFYAITTSAKLIASQEVAVYSANRTTQGNLKSGGELYGLVNNPNPRYTFHDLLYRWFVLTKIFGYAFLAREKVGGTYYWTVLNPLHCELVIDPKTKFRALKYTVGGTDYYYLDGDFILKEEFNPNNYYYGLSQIQLASIDIQANQYSKRTATSNFKLGDPPQVALSVKDANPDVIKTLKKEMQSRTPEHGRFLVFSHEHFDLTDVSSRGGKNVTSLDVAKYGAGNIALALGFPPQLLSDTTKETRELLEYLYLTVVIPEVKLIQRTINNHFVNFTPSEKTYLKFYIFRDPIIARIYLDSVKAGASLVQSGLLSPNEFRDEFFGFDNFELINEEKQEDGKITFDYGNLPKPISEALLGAVNSNKGGGEQAQNATLPGSEGGRNKTDS